MTPEFRKKIEEIAQNLYPIRIQLHDEPSKNFDKNRLYRRAFLAGAAAALSLAESKKIADHNSKCDIDPESLTFKREIPKGEGFVCCSDCYFKIQKYGLDPL